VKILIVEDEFTSRVILEKILSHYGEVHQCVNGREGVEAFTAALARGEPFDLVCLDVMMPEMDGPEALIMIRDIEEKQGSPRRQGTKVVMTTGHNGSEGDLEAVKSLSDAVISKPVRLQDLIWTLTTLGLI
jgi:two-component system chemotaxis response regulator CheY